jgi:hypothetical protein
MPVASGLGALPVAREDGGRRGLDGGVRRDLEADKSERRPNSTVTQRAIQQSKQMSQREASATASTARTMLLHLHLSHHPCFGTHAYNHGPG